MGSRITKYLKRKRLRVLILGPDAAGKTTVLNYLKSGRAVTTIPTIGFNVEEIQIKRTKFTLWDVGGQEKLRVFWKHYFVKHCVLAYVVDASDRLIVSWKRRCRTGKGERIAEARDALESILIDPVMDDCILLVYANKQDLDDPMSTNEIVQRLGLEDTEHSFNVQPSCALYGHGIYEGLQWAKREAAKRHGQAKKEPKSVYPTSTTMEASRLSFCQ